VFVSPYLAGAAVKGELLPTLAARNLLSFLFVSPYLAGKPDLDDTDQLSGRCRPGSPACVTPISPGASVKGELLQTLAARTCFLFRLFRLICLASQIWMIQTNSPTTVGLALRLVFRPIWLARRQKANSCQLWPRELAFSFVCFALFAWQAKFG